MPSSPRPHGAGAPPLAAFVLKPKPGFALILSVVLVLVVSTGALLWFQQSIRSRFQSQAFLDNQRLFHDIQTAVQLGVADLQSRTATELQSEQAVTDALAPMLPGWSGTTTLDGSDLLLTLRPPPEIGAFAVEALLRLKPLDLSAIPWVLFEPMEPHVPAWLELESGDLATVTANRSWHWLKTTPSGVSPDHTFPHGSRITWQGTQFSVAFADGTSQAHALSGQALTIQAAGDLTWDMDFQQVGVPWLWLDVSGDLTLRLPSSAPQHLSAAPVVFVSVGGNLKLQRQSGSIGAGQVGGFFRVSGGSCVEMSVGVSAYWTGGLACESYQEGSGQIRLRSGAAPDPLPAPFIREMLQPDGVRIQED